MKDKRTAKIVRAAIYVLVLTSLLILYLFYKQSMVPEVTRWDGNPKQVINSSMAEIVILFTLLMVVIGGWSIRKSKKNTILFIGPGAIFYIMAFICALDMLLDRVGIPATCGAGVLFSQGNCILLDGFDATIYQYIVPPFFVVGTTFFILNRTHGTVYDDPEIPTQTY